MKSHFQSDRGATAVMVAILLVPLIGFGGIAVDVGAIYAERAQLQNGADAAALAIAQDCAADGCGDSASEAAAFANANANDGAANVYSLTFPTATSVKVVTSTRVAGTNAGAMNHPLAALVGVTPSTVGAEAIAEWGPPKAAPVLPLTISNCEFEKALDGTPQLIRYDKNQPCPDQQIPGGFGWLDPIDGECEADIDLDQEKAGSEPGNSYPGACDQVLMDLAGQTILVPIFDHAYDKDGTEILADGKAVGGQNGFFHIYAFAAFTITNWRLSGGNKLPEVYMDGSPVQCNGECRGIIGTFDHWVSVDAAGTELGGPDLGASVARLVLEETP